MRKKVLVIEDSGSQHRASETALKAYPGCEVEPHFAASGLEGLARLHEHPDTRLVMLDVNMPSMTGLEFLAHLRAAPALRDIPVVLQSPEDRVADVRQGLSAGARGFLAKPFTPEQLHRLLDVVLV